MPLVLGREACSRGSTHIPPPQAGLIRPITECLRGRLLARYGGRSGLAPRGFSLLDGWRDFQPYLPVGKPGLPSLVPAPELLVLFAAFACFVWFCQYLSTLYGVL